MSDQILYEDGCITLTKDYILLRKYYFPLATSKTIMFTDIQSVEINDTDGVTHLWGICTKYLNNWFSLDKNRSAKKKFIAIKMKHRNVKPSFTPDNPDRVIQIIWENYTPQGQQYAQRKSSQVGKQTEIDQQEIMNKLKQQNNDQQVTCNELQMKT